MITTDQVEAIETEKPMQQATIEKSFVKGVYEFNGQAMQPYSASREAAADCMALKYSTLNEADVGRFEETGEYPGMRRDIAIIMWLCCKATEEEIDLAGVNGIMAARKAVEWAREVGLQNTNSTAFQEGRKATMSLLNDVWSARTKAEKKSPS